MPHAPLMPKTPLFVLRPFVSNYPRGLTPPYRHVVFLLITTTTSLGVFVRTAAEVTGDSILIADGNYYYYYYYNTDQIVIPSGHQRGTVTESWRWRYYFPPTGKLYRNVRFNRLEDVMRTRQGLIEGACYFGVRKYRINCGGMFPSFYTYTHTHTHIFIYYTHTITHVWSPLSSYSH